MIASEMVDHFHKCADWVDWNNTTDRITAGDPSRKVTKVAVSWKANWGALRKAAELGAQLFVSHESICVNAVNGSTDPESTFALDSERAKFEWLQKSGLVVFRCHDAWDNFPALGIRDSWREGLHLDGMIVVDEYPCYVTKIEPIRLVDLAQHILSLVKPLGQNGVLFSGDEDRVVSTIATGTGVSTNPVWMHKLGADVPVITNDYYVRVRMGSHAEELDIPTIMVDHGVSEEWGIQSLARYLSNEFMNLEVIHIPHLCGFSVVV
jgi:putative NIF3 family GTP cyclohydrolase 1 type 2